MVCVHGVALVSLGEFGSTSGWTSEKGPWLRAPPLPPRPLPAEMPTIASLSGRTVPALAPGFAVFPLTFPRLLFPLFPLGFSSQPSRTSPSHTGASQLCPPEGFPRGDVCVEHHSPRCLLRLRRGLLSGCGKLSEFQLRASRPQPERH